MSYAIPDPPRELTDALAPAVVGALGEWIAAALTSSDQTSTPPSRSRLVNVEEAMSILRCRKRHVYDLVADGRLTRCGEGRRLLLLRDEVEERAFGDHALTPMRDLRFASGVSAPTAGR